MRGIRPIPTVIVGVLLMALHAYPVCAQVQVQGPVEDVRLEARDATVDEILAALRTRFDLHYRGTALNRRVTATYAGPLRRVLAHVLKGYDYVFKADGANIEVLVLGTASPREAISSPILRRRAD